MTVSTVRERYERMLERMNASEGMFIATGVSAVVVGILVDVFVLRLVCLFFVLGSAVLVIASLRAKHLRMQPGIAGQESRRHTHSESEVMKKLIFDDYQIQSKERESFEEAAGHQAEEAAAEAPAAPDIPAHPVVPHGAAMHEVEERPAREFCIADFFDVDSDIYKGEAEPRTEFDFLLNKLLGVLKGVLFANTVAFFWANREKRQMVLEAKVTDSPQFMSSRRFSIGEDFVSKVAESGKPEFITEVNPVSECELIPYYDTPAAIHSFIGVPVYFVRGSCDRTQERPVAVLAVDSKAEDDFGPETLALLGQFTKLISALIKSYNDKYDLLLNSELLSSIRRLQERVRNNFTLPTIVQSLAEETSKLINWDFLAVVLYDEARHAWLTKKVTNRTHEPYLTLDQAVDFPDSLVAETIRTNAHSQVDDLEGLTGWRYCASETAPKKGSFVSVPISSLNKCYGAVCLESRERYNFTRKDVEMLYRMADHSASALEIFYMQEIINEYVIIDDVTGVYSRKFFVQRLDEELQRADDGGSDLSLLLITIDRASEIKQRFGNEGFERVMLAIAKALRNSIRPYDIAGRTGNDQFGVALLSTAANDAYLWAEKIRKNIASLVITLEGKNFSLTISIGVCGALEGMRKEELLGNAVAVLGRAAEAGGNVVRVF